jgi:integrase
MANRHVSIWIHRKTVGRWGWHQPSIGRNHKLKPEDGVYYIRYREGKKLIWRKCSSAADATVARERQVTYLKAVAHGMALHQTEAGTRPVMMSDVLGLYLEEYRLSHRKESHALMQQTLEEFHAWNRKNIMSHISRVDLLRYRAWLIDKGLSPRTAANKMFRVNQFIRSVMGLPEGKGPVTVKDAKLTELEPTVFNDNELKAFFAECTPFQIAVFKTYWMSGLRKAELENLEWTDVDFKAGTITVSPKAGFDPKDWEQRSIEVLGELLAILKELPKKGSLVFANGSGNKYTHSWDDCKKIAERAGDGLPSTPLPRHIRDHAASEQR